MIYFISGHLDLTLQEFVEHYIPPINVAVREGASIVVGDARGCDTMAQLYLLGKSAHVTVYHMHNKPRNNAGFATCGGFVSDEDRDLNMTYNSNADIAWTRPGRQDSGTQRNLDRRVK